MACSVLGRRLRPVLRAATAARHRCYSEWTRQSETVSFLRDPRADREIYLIGTAHISQKSAAEVQELIHLVRPKTRSVT